MNLDIIPIVILAALAYPAGCFIGYVLDRTIKAIWPPKPPPCAVRQFHIRKI
jgi:hypothetical protein